MAHPLLELQRLGQSPWFDNIHRQLLRSGKLKAMVDNGEVTGLTSNPTIFEQAISQSADYDDSIRAAARAGKSAEATFDALSIEDIQAAADTFAPVFERTRGADGYVSIEVAPRFAHDTAGTVAEAQRIWKAVARRNLMVKIPATLAGVPAIEQTIAEGINVNVTLIFSLERYAAVMDAYVKGLAGRHQAGQPVDRVASVASFFVSRVDSAVDKLLTEKAKTSPALAGRVDGLLGKAAIANAKLAYSAFQERFSAADFTPLEKAGARRQRPLWASTSTKNPKYPDVYYVEALIGRDTVDTLPPATAAAYLDHGKPALRVTEDLPGARKVLADLAELGIDMAAVTLKLEEEGVAAFAKSFDSLIAVVEKRRAEANR